jgi:hypothetical protein
MGGARVEELLPRINGLIGPDGRESAPLALATTPVIDELVARDAYQPGDGHRRRVGALERRDRGNKRLSGQVFGFGNAAAAREEIAINLR